MMNGPTLPPQAYTREILTAAFNWLQAQPESVKKLAQTPDALVGLYMRAQRYGASSMEVDAPVSSQHFMSDLKNLAEGLKQFEAPRRSVHAAPTSTASPIYSAPPGANPSHTFVAPELPATSFHAAQPQNSPPPNLQPPFLNHQQSSAHSAHSAHSANHSVGSVPGNSHVDAAPTIGLQERTQQMIHEVKTQLNLSSNAEAINMMVALAYKQIKNLIRE